MKTMQIGTSDMRASVLALGCMRICRKPIAQGDALIHTALDLGINFFDHADVYGFGKSEEYFGQILDLRSSIREKIYLQSKCTLIRDEVQTLYNDSSKEHIIRSVEASLKRLKTDYLDSYLLHAPDTLVEPEEVAEAFSQLRRDGKVRWFGVSNHSPLQIQLLERYLGQKLVISQVQLSVAHPDLIDASGTMRMNRSASADGHDDLLTFCRLNDISIQAWSPFQFGFYGGVYMGNEDYPQLNAVTNRLSEEKGVSPSAIAVAWILRHPAKIQPLIGTTNRDRLADICTAVGVELSRAEWYELYRAQLADEGKADLTSSVSKAPAAK